MRTIVHLSDLHFGRLDTQLIEPLLDAIVRLEPQLVVISGDLTQRARAAEFRQAKAFLDRLTVPQLTVPGNHDVPLYNLVERVLDPLRRYRETITSNLTPIFRDEEMIVVGLNSARTLSSRSGGGRLSLRQADWAAAQFSAADAAHLKVVVTHHPFDLPEGYARQHLIGRAEPAMRTLARAGVDLFLAGHLHLSHVGATSQRYQIAGHSALVVQAGTLSTRERGEPNGFNVIRLARPHAVIEHHTWALDRFSLFRTSRYRHTPNGWTVDRT